MVLTTEHGIDGDEMLRCAQHDRGVWHEDK
jgi:hypothetical protein